MAALPQRLETATPDPYGRAGRLRQRVGVAGRGAVRAPAECLREREPEDASSTALNSAGTAFEMKSEHRAATTEGANGTPHPRVVYLRSLDRGGLIGVRRLGLC